MNLEEAKTHYFNEDAMALSKASEDDLSTLATWLEANDYDPDFAYRLHEIGRQEIKAIVWEETGGPERQAKKDRQTMTGILVMAEAKGWEVLKRWTASDGWGGKCEHVVLMRDDELVNAHFMAGQLMKKLGCGSARWEP